MAWVLAMLALYEGDEIHEPQLENVQLVQESLDMKLKVAVLFNLRLGVRESPDVELDVPHRVYAPENVVEVVTHHLAVPAARRVFVRRRRRAELEDVLVALSHEGIGLP